MAYQPEKDVVLRPHGRGPEASLLLTRDILAASLLEPCGFPARPRGELASTVRSHSPVTGDHLCPHLGIRTASLQASPRGPWLFPAGSVRRYRWGDYQVRRYDGTVLHDFCH